jgi:hypothetical protein
MDIRRLLLVALTIAAVLAGIILAPLAYDKYLAYAARKALQAPPSPANDEEQQSLIRTYLLSEENHFIRQRLRPYFDLATPRGICLNSERAECDRFEMYTLSNDTGLVDLSDHSISSLLQMQLEKQVTIRERNAAPLETTIPVIDIAANGLFVCHRGELCRCNSSVERDSVFLRLSRAVMSRDRQQALALSGRIFCDGSAGYYKLLFEKRAGNWRISKRVYVGGGL